jgi:hypothetical protein
MIHVGIGWPDSPRRASMWARRVNQRLFRRRSTPTISQIGRFVSAPCWHRDVGVQIRVARPTVAVCERGSDQASDIDLPDPLRPGPGEQGMLLDECQRVLDGGLMGPFDHSRHRQSGDRP